MGFFDDLIGGIFGGGGEALGAAGSIAAAELQAAATRDAAKINAENQKDINAANLQLSRDARGANGLPTSLPLYSGGTEQDLFNKANAAYGEIMNQWGDANQQYTKNAQRRDAFRPAMTGANQIASDLFTGGQTANRLTQQQPVSQARLNVAGAQKQGINTSIQQRLNQIKAIQANRGYVGSSTYDSAAALREVTPMYQQAAEADAMARLQNQLDIQGIYNTDRQQALSNLSIPAQMTQQNIQWEQMPATTMVEGLNNAYSVYSPFRLNEWNPPTMQNMPKVDASATGLGAAAVGVGAATNAYDDYLKDKAQKEASQSYLDALVKITQGNQANQNSYSTYPNYDYTGGVDYSLYT